MAIQPLDMTAAERIGPPLKVWWIPQIPMKPFEVLVNSFAEAKVLLESLAQYDLFQLKHKIKPDFSNAGGLMIQEDGEWTDWTDDDGNDIDTIGLEECIALDRQWYNHALVEAARGIEA